MTIRKLAKECFRDGVSPSDLKSILERVKNERFMKRNEKK